MKYILLISLCLFALSQAQNCGENEEFNECGSRCPPTCQKKEPQACVMMCVAGCFCKQGYLKDNATGTCVLPEKCSSGGTSSIAPIATLPCVSGMNCTDVSVSPIKVKTCGEHEVFDACASSCESTCSFPNTPKCRDCRQMCVCEKGYIRHNGKCVEQTSCQDHLNNPCLSNPCKSGETCEVQTVNCIRAPCYPIAMCAKAIGSDPCMTVRCAGGICKVKDGVAHCFDQVSPGDSCSANQTYSECTSPCPKKCGVKQNMACVAMCGPPNCECNSGYAILNNTCVLESDCPGSALNPCAAITCPVGYYCFEGVGGVDCYPQNGTTFSSSSSTSSSSVSSTTSTSSTSSTKTTTSPSSPSQTKNCKAKEIWDSCGGCEPTCEEPEKNCARICSPGKCVCRPGYVRLDDKCVEFKKCPDVNVNGSVSSTDEDICEANEVFTECVPKCENTCRGVDLNCTDTISTTACTSGCVCRAYYKRNANGKCVHQQSCYKNPGCKKNESWQSCMPCEESCSRNSTYCDASCFSGCACKSGFARDNSGECILNTDCPSISGSQ